MTTKKVLIFNASVWQWESSSNAATDSVSVAVPRGRVLHQHQIHIEDGFIKDICPSITSVDEKTEQLFDSIVDAKGRLVLPGLIGKSFLLSY